MSEWRRGCNVESYSNMDSRDGKRERYDNRNRNRDRNRNRNDNRKSDRNYNYNYRMENEINQIKPENNQLKNNMIEEKPDIEYKPQDNKYANIVRGTETVVEENPRINVNDPTNWRGAIWIGPRMVRMRKSNSKMTNKNYSLEGKGYVTPGTVIISTPYPYEHSRDGLNWYKSFKDTFTEEQLDAIRKQEEEEMHDRWCERSNELYEKRRMESLRHYYETGEEDGFMIAERESREYDAYVEKLEREIEEYEEEEEEEEECYDSESSIKSY